MGLDWPFWPLMAFNDFFRPREVFMGINQVKMTTFHPSDIKNGHHTRFTKAVHSGMYILENCLFTIGKKKHKMINDH